jgi:hypothetical protein
VSQSTWLKIAGNGALGEARVRAMLLERFHVLTRSVDSEGADFFIQLQTSGRFSDELAPRLGIIQAKFSQDKNSSHLVPVEYALDRGRSVDEFFVLVTVGREDDTTNYLVSGSDLTKVRRIQRDGKEFYSLTAREMEPFRQQKVSSLLEKIQHNLKFELKNKIVSFIRRLRYRILSSSALPSHPSGYYRSRMKSALYLMLSIN